MKTRKTAKRNSGSTHPSRKILGQIRLFATDVDGVLTDGGMYYAESGDEWKKFNTRDGMGIKLLQKAGLITAIVTQERTRLVARRAEKLAIPEDKLDARAQLSAAAAGNTPRGYDLALRLARNGAAAEEIAKTSGVTRQEAELLARLHGPDTIRLRTGT